MRNLFLCANSLKNVTDAPPIGGLHIDIYTDENQTIVCKLKNSHHPKDATSDKSGSGIGIENLKRRLELIYPSNHSFTSGVEENVYYSTLIINPIIKNEI